MSTPADIQAQIRQLQAARSELMAKRRGAFGLLEVQAAEAKEEKILTLIAARDAAVDGVKLAGDQFRAAQIHLRNVTSELQQALESRLPTSLRMTE